MNGAQLQTKQDRINARTARHIGFPCAVYRSASMLNPISAGNIIHPSLSVSFAPDWSYWKFNKPKNPFWNCLTDGSQIAVGDWIVGEQGTFYVADKQLTLPTAAVSCNRTISIVRPEYLVAGAIDTLGSVTGGTLYTDGTYLNVPLTGGHGNGVQATVVISGGSVSSVIPTAMGDLYAVGDALSANAANIGGTGSGFSVPVATLNAYAAMTSVDTLTASSLPVFEYTSKDRGGNPSGFAAPTETHAEMPEMEVYINARGISDVKKDDVIIDELGDRYVIDTYNPTDFGFIVIARIEKP